MISTSAAQQIRVLTSLDRKSVTGMLMKVVEEVGELSGALAGYEHLDGARHRMKTEEDVLEEVIDTILSACSIACKLGTSEEAFESMLQRKIQKWADIQKTEAKAKDILPFEIHVTVKNEDTQRFIDTCKIIDVKPIVLDLQAGSETIADMMTSSKFMGNNLSAYHENKRISSALSEAGFTVLREKIETVSWHPAAPNADSHVHDMPKDCYFEAHLGLVITDGSDMDALKQFCEHYKLHLSKNAFKRYENGNYTQMATLRMYTGYADDFVKTANRIRNQFVEAGFDVEKLITEFSLYDTRMSHDAQWLNAFTAPVLSHPTLLTKED
jgi:NTP pyrophosphatase (non-canonical NTP hydrolase)